MGRQVTGDSGGSSPKGTAVPFCVRPLAYSWLSAFTSGKKSPSFLVSGLWSERSAGLGVGPWKLAGLSSLCDPS